MPESAMEKINKFTRRELKEDEVYRFSVILCDNEIDRDGEKFTKESLEKLSKLYIGKTGIWSHDPKGENQTARIYDARVIADPTRKTADGEEYRYLKAEAYMVRTESNADLIKEIDGGIKKEVSVGCSVSRQICSICGADRRKGGCMHRKGATYSGRKCFDKLIDPTDAYEWSFVAVPAQPAAGVTKRYSEEISEKVPAANDIAEELCEDLKKDIMRLSYLSGDGIPAELTKAAIERMEPFELLKLKRALYKSAASYERGELEKALAGNGRDAEANSSFRV